MTGGSILDRENPLKEPVSLFLVQAIVIIITSRLLAIPLAKLNQPRVIAEVLGGIILGNSALSRIDSFRNSVFPTESLPSLKLVANIGLILFLFLIGLELDPSKMLGNLKTSFGISVSGIITPFALGVAASKALYDNLMPDIKPSFATFTIFTGVAMSITAFPVLARILIDRELLPTRVGQVTLAAAAVDDAAAWCLLLIVIALVNNTGNYLMALWAFLIVIAYALFLFFIIRPLFARYFGLKSDNQDIPQSTVFVALMIMAVSAFFTNALGVDAIFGGFLAGLTMPHDHGFAIKLTCKFEDLVAILFLPLYFAYSGLNTRLDQLNDGMTWGLVVLVIVVACAGKIIGCGLAARLSGLGNRESLTIGVLMNTKGLVELIVLNLGLQAGVINVKVFTVLVLMALVTTFITVPIVAFIYPKTKYMRLEAELKEDFEAGLALKSLPLDKKTARMLIVLPSITSVSSAISFIRAIHSVASKVTLSILRLLDVGERTSNMMMATESEMTVQWEPSLQIFRSIRDLSGVDLSTHLAVTNPDNYCDYILDTAHSFHANMVLVPLDLSVSPDKKMYLPPNQKLFMQRILKHTPCSVAVLLDRGVHFSLQDPGRIIVPFIGGPHGREAILLAQYLSTTQGKNVKILRISANPSANAAVEMEEKNAMTVDNNFFKRFRTMSNLSNENSQLTMEPTTESTKFSDEDQQALDDAENFGCEIIPMDVDIVSRALLAYMKNANVGRRDLVIMGLNVYSEDHTAERHTVLSQWLDSECSSNICIVRKG